MRSIKEKAGNLVSKAVVRALDIDVERVMKSTRPNLDSLFVGGFSQDEAGIKLPPTPWNGSYLEFYILVDTVYVLDQVISKITEEIFKRPEDSYWEKRFELKCTQCKAEYDRAVDVCSCGSTEFREPDESQKVEFQKFIETANDNGQDIFDVLEQGQKDTDITDDGYIILTKDYMLDAEGGILFVGGSPIFAPKEILRGHPETMRLVSDKAGRPGGKYWKCLIPGCDTIEMEENRDIALLKRCRTHGTKLHDVHVIALENGQPSQFYIKGEVFHWSKHNPSVLYGKTPLIGLYKLGLTLREMVEYIWKTYENERPPRGALFIPTANIEALTKTWGEQEEIRKKNPNHYPVIAVQTADNSKGEPKQFNFTGTVGELEYFRTLEEFRRGISARYGVSLIFQADTSTSGGLNNEGLQITVTDRAVEKGLSVLHRKPIGFLHKQFGITDWLWRLPPARERDETAELDREAKEIANALSKQKLGYVATMGENGEFTFDFDPDKALEIQGGGAIEGVGGPLFPASPQGGREEEALEPVEEKALLMKYLDPRKDAILEALESGALYSTFKGMTATEVRATQEIIIESMLQPQGWSTKSIVDRLKGTLPEDVHKNLAVIVRNETHSITNLARAMEYEDRDPEGKALYKWIGPQQPGRTTEICTEIKKRQPSEGLPMDELLDLTKQVAGEFKESGGTPGRDWQPHYQCRHTFRRAFALTKSTEAK